MTAPRQPSPEWYASSNWEEVVVYRGGYVLGVGYCYVTQLAEFFKTQNQPYFFFETKWGRCGTTFLFSALRPDSVIILSAWGNATTLCKKPDTFFHIWQSILRDVVRLDVPIMMVEMPAAWHLSNLAAQINDDVMAHVASARQNYAREVLAPVLDRIEYVDLMDYVPTTSKIIRENTDGTVRAESPWHIAQPAIQCIGENFMKFVRQQYARATMIDEIRALESTL